MKQTSGILMSGSLCAMMLVGCSTPRPAEMAITQRDRDTYTDEGATAVQKEVKHRVAILTKQDNVIKGREVADALDASLTSAISDFAFFSIVERSNLDALLKEKQLEALNSDQLEKIDIPEAQYLITAKVNAPRIEKSTGLSLASASLNSGQQGVASYKVTASVDFRFYEKMTGRTVLVKNIESEAPGTVDSAQTPTAETPEAVGKLKVAVQECAKLFAMELGSRYAPPARVVETRGGGKVAKVTMGTNYGLVKGVKVEFFEYVDHSDVVAGAVREPSPVGYGVVLESEQNSSWAEVLEPDKTFVKRGHYVRITSDQSKALKTQIIDAVRLQ